MTAPVQVAFNRDQTRAAFRLFHAKGNIITGESQGYRVQKFVYKGIK